MELLLPVGSRALAGLTLADTVPGAEILYRERYRPQFHFTAPRLAKRPQRPGLATGPVSPLLPAQPLWHRLGHHLLGARRSPDLFHWTELPVALRPQEYGDGVYSGSAVVDTHNTSGWGTAGNAPIVAAYTSVRRGECIVYSTDGGLSFTEFEGNPPCGTPDATLGCSGMKPRALDHGGLRRH